MKKRGILILFSACLFLVGCGEKKIISDEKSIDLWEYVPVPKINIEWVIEVWKTQNYHLVIGFENTNTWYIDWEIVEIKNWKYEEDVFIEKMEREFNISAENEYKATTKKILLKREKTEEEIQKEKQEEEKRLKELEEKKEDWLKQYRQNMWTNNNTLYNILLDENNNGKYFRVDCIDSCKNWEVKVTLKDDEATEKRSKTSEKANMKENKTFATRYTNLMYNKTSKDFIIITHLYYKWEEVSICAWWINKYYVECYK